MKHILTTLLLLAGLPHLSAQSRIETFSVSSELLGDTKTCSVYLPACYDADPVRRYPVLYLLHGASDTHTAWLQKGNTRQIADEAIAEGCALPMIIVMPDASGTDDNHMGPRMGYFDVPGWPYERFFFEELLPAVESHYRIIGDKKHRAIAGLSMGGGGTTVYAQRHPEHFSSACPLSALMEMPASLHIGDDAFSRSVRETSPLEFLHAITAEKAAAMRTVRWWADCGDDDFLWEGNIRFYEVMRRNHIPLEFRMRNGGHTWRYWSTALPDILTFISVGFSD